MDCKQVTEVLFLIFDGELEDDLRRPAEDHLSNCPGCAQRLALTRKLLIVVRQRCIRQTAPARLRQKILASLPHRQQRLT